MAKMAGQEDTLDDANLDDASEATEESKDKWCCSSQVIALQEDFLNEKPEIQHYLERRGQLCMFYPKFHCKINLIEMLWGYMKYRKAICIPFIFVLTQLLISRILCCI